MSNKFTPAKKMLHNRWLWWLRHLEGLPGSCPLPGLFCCSKISLAASSSSLQTGRWKLSSVHCTAYSVHCTVCTVHCTVYTLHYTLNSVNYKIETAHCTPFIVYCSFCSRVNNKNKKVHPLALIYRDHRSWGRSVDVCIIQYISVWYGFAMTQLFCRHTAAKWLPQHFSLVELGFLCRNIVFL